MVACAVCVDEVSVSLLSPVASACVAVQSKAVTALAKPASLVSTSSAISLPISAHSAASATVPPTLPAGYSPTAALLSPQRSTAATGLSASPQAPEFLSTMHAAPDILGSHSAPVIDTPLIWPPPVPTLASSKIKFPGMAASSSAAAAAAANQTNVFPSRAAAPLFYDEEGGATRRSDDGDDDRAASRAGMRRVMIQESDFGGGDALDLFDDVGSSGKAGGRSPRKHQKSASSAHLRTLPSPITTPF